MGQTEKFTTGSGTFSGSINLSNNSTSSGTGEITDTTIVHDTPTAVSSIKQDELIPTYGERIVGVKFNPSGMNEVDEVKQFFAKLIDDAHARHDIALSGGVFPQTRDEAVGAASRAFVHQEAISKLSDACMAIVKSIVIK